MRGFSLVELLVSMALMVTIGATLLRLMTSASVIARAQPAAADVQQRARVALVALGRDLARAGAGLDGGPLSGALAQYVPAIGPSPEGGIAIWYVSSRDAQGALPSGAEAGTTEIVVRSTACPVAQSACAFSPSTNVLLFDAAGCSAIARVDHVTDVTLQLRTPIAACGIRPGGAAAQVEARTFYVDPIAHQLIRRDEATGIDLPLLDDVDSMRAEYFDAVSEGATAIDPVLDPRNVRRVRVTLRLMPPDMRAGVPAFVFALDVAPPNLSLR
jgi:type II secretory pathway pseudopilin PulG